MGVDVYALAVGLLQKQLHIVQVMTADHYERSLFNCEWDFSRDRVAVASVLAVVGEAPDI